MAHAYGLDVTDACVMAAFCDYDRDGWLDVSITTNLLNIGRAPRRPARTTFSTTIAMAPSPT